MISSMTGYGHGEATASGITATAEVKSVNSRFLEVSSRLPRTIGLRENDVKDLVRIQFTRGKIFVVINIEHTNMNETPLSINVSAAKSYYKLLNSLRKAVKIQERVSLDHLLKFSEVLEIEEHESGDDQEWSVAEQALRKALEETAKMRNLEGKELEKDLTKRIQGFHQVIDNIERISRLRIPEEQVRLRGRVRELVSDVSIIDERRLELEIALLADRLDVTEECVRFRSHIKFFLDAMDNKEAAGRKLNFLAQEINREANTIGSKSNDVEIAHFVVGIKEEVEKIREQLQNIE